MSQQDNGHTSLDRTLVLRLEHPDDTPSRRHGVTARTERLHRLHGVTLIRNAWEVLLPDKAVKESSSSSEAIPESDSDSASIESAVSIKAAAFCTSSTLLHRFYHNVSLQDVNVWSAVMACTLLAAKLLEVPSVADVRKVITVYAHLYRKRIIHQQQAEVLPSSASQGCLHASLIQLGESYTDKNIQSFIKPSGMSPMGPLYKEWKDAIVDTEHRVLRALGFLLHWVPNQMPHKYLGLLLSPPQSDNNNDDKNDEAPSDSNSLQISDLFQRAWQYCNDSLYLDLGVRVSPQVIACSSLLLAQLDLGLEIFDSANTREQQQSWFVNACGPASDADISMVCNALLGIRQQLETTSSETYMAAFGFIKSLEPDDGSFNDPLSFVWEMESTRWKELLVPP